MDSRLLIFPMKNPLRSASIASPQRHGFFFRDSEIE